MQHNNHHMKEHDNPIKIHFLDSLTTIPVPSKLLEGVEVIQVAANGTTKPVLLAISNDKFTLRIFTAEKKGFFRTQGCQTIRLIDLGEMDRIQRGQSTEQFEKARLRKPHIVSRTASTGATIPKRPPLPSRNATVGSTQQNNNNNMDLLASSSPTSASAAMLQQLDPQRSFSIIFRGAHTVDLMAASLQERNQLCDCLDRILLAYQRAKIRVAHDVQLLRYAWLDVDKDKTGYITVHQLAKVLHQLNFEMKAKDLHATFDKFGKVIGLDRAQRRRGLSFEQSATFLHKMRRDSWMVKPVNLIWNQLFGEVMNNGKMRTTVSEKTFLERFLHGMQGEVKLTMTDVRVLFRKLHDFEAAHTTSELVDLSRITKEHFEAYLTSTANDCFEPSKEKTYIADMDQPLSEYWINSSHNTYLVGDQYTSHSRVEMYSNALYRGCRCLELDMWDGPKTSNGTPIPVVWHGHTMTSKIMVVDIFKTIKVFLNFHPDSFPIILSFENHCSIPYQEVIADQLERILGDTLYIPTEASLHGKLPSPNQLRGQVVIKGRRPDGTEADQYDSDDDSDDGGPTSSMGSVALELEAARTKVKQHGVAPELARLSLFHGHKLLDWENSTRAPNYFMHSFSENKVRSHCRRKESHQWIGHNQTHMSRTYPAGSRVDSSNYNPLLAWSMGCQMVALNFQTQDAFLRLNDGRFRENGNCGYVLKPPSLLQKDATVNAQPVNAQPNPVRLSVRVLSGSCLPKPKGERVGDCIDPYIKVAIYDVKNEEKEATTWYQTSAVAANGFFPIWGQEKFTFNVENWEVAMLQFTVITKAKEEFIATSSIPISCLRRGVRSVKLYDATNTRSGPFDFASLLVDIKIGHVSHVIAEC
jgi:phosphatidylinositol phospholipase C delta